jgi:hypothetical protein
VGTRPHLMRWRIPKGWAHIPKLHASPNSPSTPHSLHSLPLHSTSLTLHSTHLPTPLTITPLQHMRISLSLMHFPNPMRISSLAHASLFGVVTPLLYKQGRPLPLLVRFWASKLYHCCNLFIGIIKTLELIFGVWYYVWMNVGLT